MTEFDYRRVLETLADAVLAADSTHRIVFANRPVEALLGWKADSLAGRPLSDVVPRPVHANDMGQKVRSQAVGRDGRPRDVEVVMNHAGGDSDLFVVTLRPLPVGAGNDSAAQILRSVLETVPVGVILAEGSEAKLSYTNSAASRILGDSVGTISYAEFVEKFALERLDGRPIEKKDRPIFRTIETGEASRETVKFRRRDGRETVMELAAVPFANVRGGAVLTVTDVTDRHRQEQDSAERAAQFRALLDHLPVGVAYFDKMAVCRAGNGPARRFLGRSRLDIAGATADELFVNEPALREALKKCVQDNGSYTQSGVAWPDPARSGRVRYLDWQFQPLTSESIKTRGALALIVDVTEGTRDKAEIQRAMEVAQGASRRKTQFLSAVSHDLRTPVNALSLQAELLGHLVQGRDDPEGELKFLAGDIKAVAVNLIELINDLLDLTRFDSGAVVYQIQDFSLDDWLSSTLAPLELSARTKGLDFSWHADLPGRKLRGDRVKIGRVLVNLVGNAIKFTEVGEVETLVGVDEEGCVYLEVRDTGLGIPADQQERIFDEFAQLRNPERDRTKGTGLGLAICRRLVEGAGGRLQVESQPGRGSRFTAIYPPDHLGPAPESPETPPPLPKNGETLPMPLPHRAKILLVEDDPNSRTALAKLLEHSGYEVVTADNGVAAIEMIARHRPALVLLDLILPGLDGMEVLRQVRAVPDLSGVKIIILSGDIEETRLSSLNALQIDGVLAKPVEIEDLRLLLARQMQPSPAGDPS